MLSRPGTPDLQNCDGDISIRDTIPHPVRTPVAGIS